MNWFLPWVSRHVRRHVTRGLPNPMVASEYYDAWRHEFERCGIDEATADEASFQLAARKHYKADHFALFMEIARGLSGAPSGVEAQREACRECEVCRGMGSVGVTEDVWNAVWTAFCTCPYGRSLIASAAAALEKSRKRPIDYDHVRRGVRFRVKHNEQVHEFTFRPIHDDAKELIGAQDLHRRLPRDPRDAGRHLGRTLSLREPARTRPEHPGPVRPF